MALTLWHNPRCSKSRQALALLEEHGADVSVRKYLEDAPTEAEIKAALDTLGITPIQMMRTKEAEFKDAGLTKDSDAAELIAAMVATPKLIERPIAFAGDKAAIGRPPENVLALLD